VQSEAGAPVQPLVSDLFRRESGRLVALLTARAGASHVGDVEDAVQEALIAAMRRWPLHGVPARPAAWLFTAARNSLTDRLRRSRFEATSASGELPQIAVLDSTAQMPDEAHFDDDLLKLIVYCSHPALSQAVQLALTLRLACGLGVEEIAGTLYAAPEAIAQRIARGKSALRALDIAFELPPARELADERLPAVLNTLYLLFDAGYLSERHDEWLRPALCADALRLVRLLVRHPATARPETFALAALLAFTAARLPARADERGQPVPLASQNRARWDCVLVAEGFRHFDRAIGGEALTRYHIEAVIAATHARATSLADTDWETILGHYEQLCTLYPSPAASLNRLVALHHARGADAAVAAQAGDERLAVLEGTLAWYATLGTLHEALADDERAAECFASAARVAASGTLREFFKSRERSALARLESRSGIC
jgi:RNA polymerase sigma-70 factor (ECF subfamily)